MKKFLLILFSWCVMSTIGSQAQASSYFSTATESHVTVVAPPSTLTNWEFYGNQGIWVYFENLNPVPVAFGFIHKFAGQREEHYVSLLPRQSTRDGYFSIFGQTPILWRFEIIVSSPVALFAGHARWDPIR